GRSSELWVYEFWRQKGFTTTVQHAEQLVIGVGSARRINRSADHELVLLKIPIELDGSAFDGLIDIVVRDDGCRSTFYPAGLSKVSAVHHSRDIRARVFDVVRTGPIPSRI